MLFQVDGESHVVHVEEEVAGTRLTLGQATCLLEKEADPSRLTSSSPGAPHECGRCAGPRSRRAGSVRARERAAAPQRLCVRVGVVLCRQADPLPGALGLAPGPAPALRRGAAPRAARLGWAGSAESLVSRALFLAERAAPGGQRGGRDVLVAALVCAAGPDPQVEVMKMMMPLLAPASGVVTFTLPEGAVLNAGDLIGRLQLDNPNAVVRRRHLCTHPRLSLHPRRTQLQSLHSPLPEAPRGGPHAEEHRHAVHSVPCEAVT